MEEIVEAARSQQENLTKQKMLDTKKRVQPTIVMDVRKQQKASPGNEKKAAKELN